MSEKKLKTGILGLSKRGTDLLQAADKTGLYEITAVAGHDPEILQNTARRYNCQQFEDYRQLVVQNELDILFVSGSMHLCADHIRSALKKNTDVLRLIPPGLDFEQTAELIYTSRKDKVRFIVANTWRFAPSFKALTEYLKDQPLERPHLITATCNTPMDPENPTERWLNDPQFAGGGVVMYNCYGIIDQVIRNFEIPHQVYSLNTNLAPDKQQRLSITEDIAIVTMRFSDTLIGNLTASRTFGPRQRQINIYSDEKYLSVTEQSFTVCDNQGNIIEQNSYPFDHDELMDNLLKNIAYSKMDPENNALFAGKDDDLNTMALIEAAYLSARTATPEEPSKVLNMVNAQPTNIWSSTGQRMV